MFEYLVSWSDALIGIGPILLVLGGWLIARKFKNVSQKYKIGDPIALGGTTVWAALFLLRDKVHWGVWVGLVASLILTVFATKLLVMAAKKFRPESRVAKFDPFNSPEWIPAIVWFVYWNFPAVYHWVFYQKIMLNAPWIVLTCLVVGAFWLLVKRLRKKPETATPSRFNRFAIPLALLGVALVWLVAWATCLSEANLMARIAKACPYTEIPSLRKISRLGFRFTALDDGLSAIFNGLQKSEAKVEEELINPAVINGGSGLVAPLVGDGTLARLLFKNPGVVLISDNLGEQRVRVIEQPFACGEYMYYPRDPWRRLRRANPFCEYGDITYTQLNGYPDDLWVMLIPQIRRTFHFPIMIPEFAGVTLVFPDGRFESLSKRAALSDPRLKGKAIQPASLARLHAEAQQYPFGVFTFRGLRNLVRIPECPGLNQYPHLMQMEDGEHYWVTQAIAAGKSDGLVNVYYENATTGERTFGKAPPGAIGPNAFLRIVATSKDRSNWATMATVVESRHRLLDAKGQKKEIPGADHVVVAPVEAKLIPRDDGLWYFANVISSQYTEATAYVGTAVPPHKLIEIRNREEFDRWYTGEAEKGEKH